MHKNLTDLDPQVDEIMVGRTNCLCERASD